MLKEGAESVHSTHKMQNSGLAVLLLPDGVQPPGRRIAPPETGVRSLRGPGETAPRTSTTPIQEEHGADRMDNGCTLSPVEVPAPKDSRLSLGLLIRKGLTTLISRYPKGVLHDQEAYSTSPGPEQL